VVGKELTVKLVENMFSNGILHDSRQGKIIKIIYDNKIGAKITYDHIYDGRYNIAIIRQIGDPNLNQILLRKLLKELCIKLMYKRIGTIYTDLQ
jgi:ferredoxin-fold anticodon binding domain-containing protein